MRGKIPKTELLVTFEVVARHESYTRAAEELALTQSAVFRQVNALEDFLHTSLFNHAKKRIFLNAAGKHYLSIVKETLNKLERDTNSIMTWQPTVQVIELAVNPTFSTHWLIPNLREFNKLNPDIIVNIHSLANIGDFLNREYDAAIMREDFCSPWSEREYLFEEEILPVCSGSLLSHPRQKLAVDELLNEFTLLHQSTRINGWQEWFALSGISSPQVNKGPRFDLLSMLIAAVRSNLGVALLPRFAIQHDLENGDMVIPCDVPIRTGNRFIMTWREDKTESCHLRVFREWLLKKSAVSREN
ncbi:LysR family transcriptional regulator [Salmonella enterica]|uniref:Regulatory protein for glycine cleavage pathway n=1 Tax=Salmonella enterica subsp. salamae TaxID=59202 RepID=A0A6D2GCD4_SALER|nr:LysR family transcriptional regulator [Salmonella enterica]EAA5903065.1 LysR family transcriptional regulator [Salmonella enterica subsp. enterica]EDW0466822.1 LysR family transcriptional regulator [Salmonella enterica subsp. enterica serovar Victoria]EAZ4757814.1 LysR family transcriptional regulator [Salmonella enterica]ECJ2425825.1 LysR family transcriptional regulator [Salmonella enterica subsp. salamae]EEP8432117.1 LysR family transcriptional regulator [Salmonella enterica subsp. salam